MHLKHLDRHTVIVISDNGQERGRLSRTGMWRTHAEILTADGLYRVKHAPFGGIEVLFNDHCIARLRSQWHGAIDLQDLSRPDRSLTVKRPSNWRHEHHLMDANGHVHAVIKSRYNRSTLRTEHQLAIPDGEEAPSVVMLLAAVHALDLRRRWAAAGT